jgi:hypothetical protein
VTSTGPGRAYRPGPAPHRTDCLENTVTNHTTVDRIPLAHSVHYAVRGMPEVPNQYGPGVLAPSEITLTYRSASDSQLGRVHAYVAGRIWVDGKELPLLPGGLYGQHYFDGLDGWPEWLAEDARLHDPDAPAGRAPATDQTALRDRIADVLRATPSAVGAENPQLGFPSHHQPGESGYLGWCALCVRDIDALADALATAVLPAPVDQAAVLHAAADDLATVFGDPMAKHIGVLAASWLRRRAREAEAGRTELRRMADETQPAPHSCSNCEGVAPGTCLMNPSRPKHPPMDPVHILGIEAQQDGAQASAPDCIVGYRSRGGRLLRCLAHHPGQESLDSGDFHTVTSEDLPDGGLCTYPTAIDDTCGVDVLIPQSAPPA